MKGNNPKRSPVKGSGDMLDVKSLFATLQGEGPYAGWPAVFVRLGGCNLACAFCDTMFEDFETRPLEEILREVNELAAGESGTRLRHLVVVTGGEPLRQPIEKLCARLLEAGFKVQIETNGTLYRDLPQAVEIVCSPKSVNGTYAPLRPDILARASALKFLISARQPGYDGVPDLGPAGQNIPVYVQPMDEEDDAAKQENLSKALELSMKNGYRLSLQLHKSLGID